MKNQLLFQLELLEESHIQSRSFRSIAANRDDNNELNLNRFPGSEIARFHSLLGDFLLDVKPTWLNRICDQQTKEDTRKRIGILNLKGILALSCIFSDRDKGFLDDVVVAEEREGRISRDGHFDDGRSGGRKVGRFCGGRDGGRSCHGMISRILRDMPIYGPNIDSHSVHLASNWCSILREMQTLKDKGFDFLSLCSKRVGDGNNSRFWLDIWKGDITLRDKFPRIFALEMDKTITVAAKMASLVDSSFRRPVRGGIEHVQFNELRSYIDSVTLSNSHDRWICNMSGDGIFRVKDIRNSIDDLMLPSWLEPTKWVKYVPIKINIFGWRARRDCLPTRANLIRRGVYMEFSNCPICGLYVEDTHHVLFQCDLAQSVLRRICRWWDLDWQTWSSFSTWDAWFSSIRLAPNNKKLLEGVFYVAWWSIWVFRNRLLFDDKAPARSMIVDDIMSLSFLWYNVLGSCRHVFGFSSELCAVVFTPATNNGCTLKQARRGVGGGVAIWPSLICIGAVNSVPLLPKIMKLVGLGYFGWLVYRYLLFKDPVTWNELCYSISGDGSTTAFAKVPVIMGSNGKKHSVQAPSRMVEHPTFNVTVSLDI
ncbi:RNA-directed DNA polymerase, eukaryota [Tanacetum coccineum]